MKIRTKVQLASGVILTALFSLAIYAVFQLDHAARSFSEYRENALLTNAEGQIQANILKTRIFAKGYLLHASEQNIEAVKKLSSLTETSIYEASQLKQNDPKLFEYLLLRIESYNTIFHKISLLQEKLDDLSRNQLDRIGPQIQTELSAIMDSAYTDDDVQAAYWAGQVIREMTLARLYVKRFLIRPQADSQQLASQQLDKAATQLLRLIDELQNPQRLKSARESQILIKKYQHTVNEISHLVNRRSQLIVRKDAIGPELAERIEAHKIETKAHQDSIGPQFERVLNNAVHVMYLVVIAVLLIGILLSVYIYRSVSRPLDKLKNSLNAIAAGDTEQPFIYPHNDEIGELSESIERFRLNSLALQQHSRHQENIRQQLEAEVSQRTEQLLQAKQKAETADQAKSAFLANISYELRTPMHAILNFSRIALRQQDSARRHEYLQNIVTSGERLTSLLNNLLDLSQLEAGQTTFHPQVADLSQIIDNSSNQISQLTMEKNIHIDFHSHGSGKCYLDEDLITRVITHLIANAVNFSPADSLVKINLFNTNNQAGEDILHVSVIDQGIGIPKQESQMIFDKFTQSSNSNDGSGGRGLGLPIVKHIIELHGGKIWVNSPPNGQMTGSEFIFEIPCLQQPAEATTTVAARTDYQEKPKLRLVAD